MNQIRKQELNVQGILLIDKHLHWLQCERMSKHCNLMGYLPISGFPRTFSPATSIDLGSFFKLPQTHPRRTSTSKSVKNWTKPFWASLWASARGQDSPPKIPGPSSGLMIVSCKHLFLRKYQAIIEMYIYMGSYQNDSKCLFPKSAIIRAIILQRVDFGHHMYIYIYLQDKSKNN